MDIQRIGNLANQPESGKKTPPPYWEDHCPVCRQKAVSGCRCPINDRTCANHHTWHWKNGTKVIGSGH